MICFLIRITQHHLKSSLAKNKKTKQNKNPKLNLIKPLLPVTNLQEIQRTEEHVTSWGYNQQNLE